MAFAAQQTLSLSTQLGGVSLNAPSKAKATKASIAVRAGGYEEELARTASCIASPGKGILAMDDDNPSLGLYLANVGLENTEETRKAYRTLLVTTPGLGDYISGAILWEEALYQDTLGGEPIVDVLKSSGIVPGVNVDKDLVPLAGTNGELWCQGLDGLASRTAAYYKQGARFDKWRTVLSIPHGPSELALTEAAWGLARYAAISQENGLVPVVEPEILLDGSHDIQRNFEVAEKLWSKVFYFLAENGVFFDGIILKASMVTPGSEFPEKATPEQVAEYTLKMMKRRVPPAVPGVMFMSGGLTDVEATLNLNAMNQSPNPWLISFAFGRALQNTVWKTWKGRPENFEAAQRAFLIRAKACSQGVLGKYSPEAEAEEARQELLVKSIK